MLVAQATLDVGIDLNKLRTTTCLPSSDASANIGSAVPRAARLVSDRAIPQHTRILLTLEYWHDFRFNIRFSQC